MTKRSAAFLLTLLALPLSAEWAQPSLAAKESRRVLVLFSQEKGHPAHDLTEEGIRQGFSSNPVFHVELYIEYLDSSRFYDPSYATVRAQYLRAKYAEMTIDAIIAVYPSAVEFLLGDGSAVFPGVPVVACEVPGGFAESLERSPSRSRITGEVVVENAEDVLETALRMRPRTKHVALVGGVARTDRYSQGVVRKGLERFGDRLELIDLTMLSMEETLARVASLPPDTIVLYSSIFRDGAGRIFVPREALSLVSRASNAPVFGLYDSYMGYGIVGGHLMSFEQSGREAADIALQVLSGQWPGAIPFVREQGYVDLYDGRELARWRIPDSSVRAGSTVLYRDPSLWKTHRQAFLAVIAALSLQAILIAALLVQRSLRRRAELALLDRTGDLALANQRLRTEASELERTRTFLEASQAELRRLAGSLLTSQEAERGKVARELHDDISQRLAGIAIETGILDREAENFGAPQKEKLKGVVKELMRLSGDVHLLSRRLHPSALDDLGLSEAMRSECARFSRQQGIVVSFEAEHVPGNLSGDVKLCLYRVLQEGLRNVAKHSGATEARVRLAGEDGALRFELKDNGGGFSPESEGRQQGLGLISMRERVHLAGGDFSLESNPGEGTILRVSMSESDGHTADKS